MDAGVVAGLLHDATQKMSIATKTSRLKGIASKRSATASGCGGAGPSAASPLLSDAVASPSSRLLASDPTALATPPHTLFQQPARLSAAGIRFANGGREVLLPGSRGLAWHGKDQSFLVFRFSF